MMHDAFYALGESLASQLPGIFQSCMAAGMVILSIIGAISVIRWVIRGCAA